MGRAVWATHAGPRVGAEAPPGRLSPRREPALTANRRFQPQRPASGEPLSAAGAYFTSESCGFAFSERKTDPHSFKLVNSSHMSETQPPYGATTFYLQGAAFQNII